MVVLYLLLLLLLSFVLVKSADVVIISLKKISRKTRTGVLAMSTIVLALGTSLPELFVGVTSALEGVGNLGLGVVIGSNIANISLVAGVTGLTVGRVKIDDRFLRRDVGVALIAGVAPLILLLDGTLSRVDGLVLLSIYGVYSTSIFKKRYREIATDRPEEDTFHKMFSKLTHVGGKGSREYARLFLGVVLMLLSADLIVKVSQVLASLMGVPVLVVGFLILAVGTSLPELAFSLRSLEDHTPSMFFGNLLGSTIANSTMIIGISSLISPIIVVAAWEYVVATVVFVIAFLIFWVFIKSKHRLDRWEAGILLFVYAIFVLVEFL